MESFTWTEATIPSLESGGLYYLVLGIHCRAPQLYSEEIVGSEAIRVLVVDHNRLMREGLILLVGLQPDMQLAGAAETAEQTVRLYIEQRPDVTLMDLDLPGRAAIAAIRKIRELHPGARIVALTTYEPDATWTEALNAGAYQCVAKDDLDGLPHLIRGSGRRRSQNP